MASGPHVDEDLRERPLGELVKQLADQTSTLVRQEIELAQGRDDAEGPGWPARARA